MSMHEIEAYVEEAIRCVRDADMELCDKRDMVHALLLLMESGDCSFTNLRMADDLVACGYTFVFPKEEMYDYEENQGFYDEELPEKNSFSLGDVYPYGYPLDGSGRVCVDSGSEAWKQMVHLGRIQGPGAEKLRALDEVEVLKRAKALMGELDEYLLSAHLGLFALSGAMERLTDDDFVEQFGMTRQELDDMFDD